MSLSQKMEKVFEFTNLSLINDTALKKTDCYIRCLYICVYLCVCACACVSFFCVFCFVSFQLRDTLKVSLTFLFSRKEAEN